MGLRRRFNKNCPKRPEPPMTPEQIKQLPPRTQRKLQKAKTQFQFGQTMAEEDN